MDTGDSECLSHLGFKAVYLPGYGNQSIRVKRQRSKREALNVVPHDFLKGFSKTTIPQRAKRAESTSYEGHL